MDLGYTNCRKFNLELHAYIGNPCLAALDRDCLQLPWWWRDKFMTNACIYDFHWFKSKGMFLITLFSESWLPLLNKNAWIIKQGPDMTTTSDLTAGFPLDFACEQLVGEHCKLWSYDCSSFWWHNCEPGATLWTRYSGPDQNDSWDTVTAGTMIVSIICSVPL